MLADLVEGKYIRVYGRLKLDKGEVSLIAFIAKPVKDYNEVRRCKRCELFERASMSS